LHIFTLIGKIDPQVFGLDLGIAEPIAQIVDQLAIEEATSRDLKKQQDSSSATVSASNVPPDKTGHNLSGQHIPTSPAGIDGDPTSIAPDVIPVMMSLFAVPQLLVVVLSVAMFSPLKLLVVLVRVVSTGYFLPFCYVTSAILRGKWVVSLAWASMVVGVWLNVFCIL
jgi:hypothetical protein